MKRQAGRQFYKVALIAWIAFSLGGVALALIFRSRLSAGISAGRRMAESHSNEAMLFAGIFGIGAGILALWFCQMAAGHRKRERDLTEAKLHAEHSNQEKTIFLANMSHEIRTPMNAILGFSELLGQELENPRHRQYLQSIRTSANSLLQLINDVLDVSRIETGMTELRPEATNLREITEFVQTLFSQAAAKKGIKLDCHLREDFPAAILIDRLRLRQILVDLVGNAIKFTDRGEVKLSVSWEKQSDDRITLVIEIQDTGVGIPRDKLAAIFKPFVQSGAHQKKGKQGSGLGLAIVKRLTEILGGTVTVASVLGEGSVFHLRFPNVPVSGRFAASGKEGAVPELNFNGLRPSRLSASPETVAELRELLAGPWPAIRDSVAVNESKRFAQRLEEIGRRRQCQPVIDYARKLLEDAGNYSVTDLEQHLGEFSTLVERLNGGGK